MEKNCRTQGCGGNIMCGKQRKYTKKNHLKQTLKKKGKPLSLKVYNWNWS
jgi:hypothetical protein